jgi:chromosome segregation ATPase
VKDRVLEKRIELAKDRGVREIERRDDALADLMKRVENMARLSDDEKARITALLQSQIDSLMTLKSRIEAASDLTTLKTDIRSIKDSYRVYFLTIPQTRITAAADKLKATVVRMTELAAKLETKVEEASAAGKDTARLSTLLTDLKTHLTEATANADEALRLVSSLTPDNGDAAKAEANMKALREAQAAIKAGHEDLKAARQDAGAIVKGLRELGVRDAKSSSDSDGSDE